MCNAAVASGEGVGSECGDTGVGDGGSAFCRVPPRALRLAVVACSKLCEFDRLTTGLVVRAFACVGDGFNLRGGLL